MLATKLKIVSANGANSAKNQAYNSIKRFALEGLSDMVHYYCLRKVTPYSAQVLHEYCAVGQSVLPVQAVFDALRLVDLAQNPVSILQLQNQKSDTSRE